jgi:hypothetical protein
MISATNANHGSESVMMNATNVDPDFAKMLMTPGHHLQKANLVAMIETSKKEKVNPSRLHPPNTIQNPRCRPDKSA